MTMKPVSEYDASLAADLIKKYEGCRLTAYKCPAGVWTIGYGHTAGVKPGMSISQAQADEYLNQDLQGTKRDLEKLCRVEITEGMFIALMSFVYNIGYKKCEGYSLFRELNRGNYYMASSWFPKYCNPGTSFSAGLKKRRLEEQSYFNRDGL